MLIKLLALISAIYLAVSFTKNAAAGTLTLGNGLPFLILIPALLFYGSINRWLIKATRKVHALADQLDVEHKQNAQNHAQRPADERLDAEAERLKREEKHQKEP